MYTETHGARRAVYGGLGRYSARKMSKPVNFYCRAPGAREVCIVGDFNGWQPGVHPMQRQPDGTWYLALPLHHGHHRYRFLADGRPVLDPRATGVSRDDANEPVSLISVS